MPVNVPPSIAGATNELQPIRAELDPARYEGGMTGEKPYILGTGGDELERLGLQHRLWSDTTHRAFRRARVAIGQRVLDVGCGPGYAAFDLAQLVTRQGFVLATDESAPFLAHVEEQAVSRGLTQFVARQGDAQDLDQVLGDEPPFGLAYASGCCVSCKSPRP